MVFLKSGKKVPSHKYCLYYPPKNAENQCISAVQGIVKSKTIVFILLIVQIKEFFWGKGHSH